MVVDACRRAGFEPTVVARSSQLDFIVELVAAGLGIAFLPKMVAEQRRHPSLRTLLLANPEIDWHIAMTRRRGAYLSHAAKAGSGSCTSSRAAFSRLWAKSALSACGRQTGSHRRAVTRLVLRSAGCVEQCPSLRAKRKTFTRTEFFTLIQQRH
jgi:hypothetical protein